MWYPIRATGHYVAVTGGSFTRVSCMGIPSRIPRLMPANNAYKNPFGAEIALFRTSEVGIARVGVSWDNPLPTAGRCRPSLDNTEVKTSEMVCLAGLQGVLKRV